MTEKKSSKTASKKGTTPWKPAQMLTVKNFTPGFRPRWCTKDPDNLRRKEEEGWIFANSTTGVSGEHERPNNTTDGGPMSDSVTDYRESVLMGLPEEIGLARDEYHKEKVRAQSHDKMQGELERDIANAGGPGQKPTLHGGISFD